MKYRKLGSTDINISAVSYGGIVSAGFYGGTDYPSEGQEASDRYVAWAIDRGVNYFDVAPSYGNAQLQLGNSLVPYRDRIHLACKTNKRERVPAEQELLESLKLLHTDHFDNYQLHGISSMEDVERAIAPGGVMELISTLKARGITRYVGITAHSEEAALRLIELYPFDTVLFPFNWFMNMAHGIGNRLLKAAKEKGMGVLAMKAFIERKWADNEDRGCFPKSWCKPIDTDPEPEFGLAAMKYALSLGVDTLIPPGNFKSFSFAVNHIEECLADPKPDMALLEKKLLTVRGMEFF
ncbi:MAG: aldo/keto reductase [Lachnospiraceae bacterium]|nr:aldo/keto reductase [Lachnospiraceae bacterium]